MALLREQIFQRPAFDILHHDVRRHAVQFFADIEDGDDARMRELSRGLSLHKKSLPVLPFLLRILAHNGNGFNGNQAVDFRVTGFVDHTHGSTTNLCQNLVATESGVLRRGHGSAVKHT